MSKIIPKVEQIIMDTYSRYHKRHHMGSHVWWRNEVESLLKIIIRNLKENKMVYIFECACGKSEEKVSKLSLSHTRYCFVCSRKRKLKQMELNNLKNRKIKCHTPHNKKKYHHVTINPLEG